MLKIILGCVALLSVTGCRVVDYTASDGSHVTITNFGFDTKIGALEASKTPEGVRVHIENLDSQSKALDVAGKALDKVPSIPVLP
jgi:hypothetical protein